MNKQQKYEQTEKGKQARRRAVKAYREKLVRWECNLSQELSNQLDAAKPEGMSKAAFVEYALKKLLDNP